MSGRRRCFLADGGPLTVTQLSLPYQAAVGITVGVGEEYTPDQSPGGGGGGKGLYKHATQRPHAPSSEFIKTQPSMLIVGVAASCIAREALHTAWLQVVAAVALG